MSNLELGIIGNGTVAGLVDEDANIVWLCLPRIDGEPVRTTRDLRLVLDRYEPGDEIEVTISRENSDGRVTLEVIVPLM